MSSDFDNQLFTKVCELEARLELAHKKNYECEQMIKEAITIIFNSGLTVDNTDWYMKAIKLLESRKYGI